MLLHIARFTAAASNLPGKTQYQSWLTSQVLLPWAWANGEWRQCGDKVACFVVWGWPGSVGIHCADLAGSALPVKLSCHIAPSSCATGTNSIIRTVKGMHRHQFYTWGNLRQTANVAFIALLRASQLPATSQVGLISCWATAERVACRYRRADSNHDAQAALLLPGALNLLLYDKRLPYHATAARQHTLVPSSPSG